MVINELRIGNFIEDIHYPELILFTEVDLELFAGLYDGTILESDLQPIPLTEKWLLKFGFEVFEFDNGQPNQYRFKDRLLVIREEKFVDYGSSVAIKYVHQLQNLYFALTGQELQLKQQTT